MPFFSKVSLGNAHRRLLSYGYAVTKKKIQKIRIVTFRWCRAQQILPSSLSHRT